MKNFYILLTIVITLYLQLACSRGTIAENNANQVDQAKVSDTLSKAEELFVQREDVSKLREAVKLVAPLRGADHRNFEVEWKFAKYSFFLGQKITDDEERGKIFENGRDAGKYASRIEPNMPDGYFWYGANLGELSKLSPVTVGLKSIDDIRQAMNKVIELQPGYQGASAYDALGQVELNTRLFGGDPKKAVEYFNKGIEIEKSNSNLRLHLAQAYLAIDKDDLAKQQLEYIVKMQPAADYVPEHKLVLEQAKKLLDSRF